MGTDDAPPNLPAPPPQPMRRRHEKRKDKRQNKKKPDIPSISSAVFPPLSTPPDSGNGVKENSPTKPAPESSSGHKKKNQTRQTSDPGPSHNITPPLPVRRHKSIGDDGSKLKKETEATMKEDVSEPLKFKDDKKVNKLIENFMNDVVSVLKRRDKFNDTASFDVEVESIASSIHSSIHVTSPQEVSSPLLKFKRLLAENEKLLIKEENERRFRSRLPVRDTTSCCGQLLAKWDYCCLKVADQVENGIDKIDDVRLVAWKRLRVLASGLTEKSGTLQNAMLIFKDIIKDSEELYREPITKVPPLITFRTNECGDNPEDNYGVFRYLDKCAEEQDIGMAMQQYKQIEYDEDQLIHYLDNMDPGIQDDYGQTIVHIAVQYCSTMVLDKMIGSGFDLNIQDNKGYTPLFYAVIANNIPTLELLLQQNININHACKEYGRRPIHVAAQFGNLDALKVLIEHGAKVDSLDNHHHTPIIISSYYSKSDVSAYLIEQGANPCIEDTLGVMGAMRIAFTMPTITREVFNQFVTEDVYQGERYFMLDRMLGSTGDTNSSFYHYLVWLGNMGLVEHPIFERLTNAKWEIYGKKRANINFGFLSIFLSIWTVLYILPHGDVNEIKKTDAFTFVIAVLSFSVYVMRCINNLKLLRKRYTYTTYLSNLFESTYKREKKHLHFKGRRLETFLKKKYGSKNITFFDDVKSSPAVLLDFLVDNLLLIFLILRLITFTVGRDRSDPSSFGRMQPQEKPTRLIDRVDLYGAVVMLLMWLTCFFKLQITKSVGPFVVYMRYCGNDLSTIGAMFIALYIPATCVFYKTVYLDTNWHDTLFLVLRMVLVDYDYAEGRESTPIDLWWTVYSICWIIISSVIILNLLIALMADSYTRIYETAELYARIERARFIIEYERTIPKAKLELYDDRIRTLYSPQIVTFDPVCDRDKIAVIEETVENLSKKFDKLENFVETRIMNQLQRRLDNIDQNLTLYSYR